MTAVLFTFLTGVSSVLAAIGRWSYHRRRWVLVAWFLVFIAGIGIGSGVFNHLKNTNGASSAESVKGFNILDDATTNGPGVIVVVSGVDLNSPSTRSSVETATSRLTKLSYVTGAVNRYNTNDPRLTS